MANPMMMLKNKVQMQKDELEKMKDELEIKCKEVDEEKAIRSSIELEIGTIRRRIGLIEHECGHAQSRLDSATRKYEAMQETAGDSENSRKVFESQLSVNDDRSVNLDREVKEAREAAYEAERKLCEASRKLKMVSAALERIEERADVAEMKANNLEEDLEKTVNFIRSKQLTEGETSEREDNYEKTIKDMTTQLKEIENKTFENERSSQKLQREVARLEDEITHTELLKEKIKKEMESYFHEAEGL